MRLAKTFASLEHFFKMSIHEHKFDVMNEATEEIHIWFEFTITNPFSNEVKQTCESMWLLYILARKEVGIHLV